MQTHRPPRRNRPGDRPSGSTTAPATGTGTDTGGGTTTAPATGSGTGTGTAPPRPGAVQPVSVALIKKPGPVSTGRVFLVRRSTFGIDALQHRVEMVLHRLMAVAGAGAQAGFVAHHEMAAAHRQRAIALKVPMTRLM